MRTEQQKALRLLSRSLRKPLLCQLAIGKDSVDIISIDVIDESESTKEKKKDMMSYFG